MADPSKYLSLRAGHLDASNGGRTTAVAPTGASSPAHHRKTGCCCPQAILAAALICLHLRMRALLQSCMSQRPVIPSGYCIQGICEPTIRGMHANSAEGAFPHARVHNLKRSTEAGGLHDGSASGVSAAPRHLLYGVRSDCA